MQKRTRKAISGAAAGVLLLIPVAVGGTVLLFAMCDSNGCNPNLLDKAISGAKEAVGLEDDPITQAQKEQQRNTRMAGYAQQLLYAVEIEHNGETYNTIEALQKHFYCETGPGDKGRYRCQNVPPADAITEAVRNFRLEPAAGIDAYSFEANGPGGQLEASKGSPSGGSRFVYAAPLAGGEHVKITIKMNQGSFVSGVWAGEGSGGIDDALGTDDTPDTCAPRDLMFMVDSYRFTMWRHDMREAGNFAAWRDMVKPMSFVVGDWQDDGWETRGVFQRTLIPSLTGQDRVGIGEYGHTEDKAISSHLDLPATQDALAEELKASSMEFSSGESQRQFGESRVFSFSEGAKFGAEHLVENDDRADVPNTLVMITGGYYRPRLVSSRDFGTMFCERERDNLVYPKEDENCVDGEVAQAFGDELRDMGVDEIYVVHIETGGEDDVTDRELGEEAFIRFAGWDNYYWVPSDPEKGGFDAYYETWNQFARDVCDT